MKKIILSVLALIIALMSTVVAVFGWLAVGTSVKLGENFSGSVYSSYFASGVGSETSPYEINRPNHLYNLAWLQNNGEFNNKTDESENTIQYYFKITADLDMTGYVLPPIGTKENPFIGILNGNGHTISNLTVSNVKKDSDMPNEVSSVPVTYNDIGSGYTDVVGFFGVIGHYPDASCNAKTLTQKVSVSNLYLDNLTVRTRTTHSLIGLFAGYVCGDVSGIGVYHSMVSIGSGVSALSNTYVSDEKQTLSSYSLIGDYHKATTGWESVEGSTGGAGAGFGGSIDMKLLSRRVNYMASHMLNELKVTPTSSSTSNANYVVNENGANYDGSNAEYTATTSFNINMYKYSTLPTSQTTESYWNLQFGDTISTREITNHLLKNTYLPLNVDLEKMGLNSDTEIIFGTTEGYTDQVPNGYHINENYFAATSETVSNSNTGYIVGGADSTKSNFANTRLNIRLLTRTDGSTIYKSLGCDKTSVSYDSKKLVLVSTDSNGNFGWIEDSYNSSTYKDNTSDLKVDYKDPISSGSFERYDVVIDQFHTLLSSSNNIYGLYFSNTINLSNITTGSGIKLNGTTYSNYQFLDSSINFSLNQSGYMTAIIGTYYSNSTSTTTFRSGFKLYQVVRNDKNEIVTDTSLTNYTREITSVWQDKNGDIQYNLSDTTGYTKVYDKNWYSGTLYRGTAYYVEIPLVSGDYAIGAIDSSSDFLMYLDIGANGADGGSSTTPTYKIEGVKFVDLYNSETFKTLSDFYAFEIVRTSTSSGVQIYFYKVYDADSSSATMYYYIDIDSTDTFVIKDSNNTAEAVSKEDAKNYHKGTQELPS